jgi:hypothetical protein
MVDNEDPIHVKLIHTSRRHLDAKHPEFTSIVSPDRRAAVYTVLGTAGKRCSSDIQADPSWPMFLFDSLHSEPLQTRSAVRQCLVDLMPAFTSSASLNNLRPILLKNMGSVRYRILCDGRCALISFIYHNVSMS